MDPILLGAVMILAGFGISLLILFFSRRISNRHPDFIEPELVGFAKETQPSEDGILFVQAGGKVLFANQLARDWFRHQESAPNLERLARSTRPSDVFLELCASEGQARFYLNGRLVEGSSYRIPSLVRSEAFPGGEADSNPVMVVSLRRPQVAAMAASDSGLSDQAVNIYTEISRAMAGSLELEKTLYTILEIIERLIPANMQEVTIWDALKKNLVPYRFVGTAGVDRRVEVMSERYSVEDGYSAYLVKQRQPLLISDVDAFREVRPVADRKHYPYSSYLGMPLLVAGELVGTLELASLNKTAFSPKDLESLRILSGQAAVAVKNALLFKEEQKRVLELSGLAQLSQAVAALGDTQDLYSRLVEGIASLLQVKTLGFFLYKESQHLLVAQKPFIGIPVPMLELFLTSIQAGSQAEAILLSDEVILAQNAQEDARFEALGMKHMSVAAGIQNTILMPLTSAGHQLGYLLAADKKNGLPFGQDDLRILTIIANQVAAIIENATLVKESRERAQRSEALRRIASLTASVATLDEILSFSLRELAQLLRADVGLIYLLDGNTGELSAHKPSVFGIPPEATSQLGRTSISEPEFHATVTASQKPFLSGNLHESSEKSPIYSPLIENQKIMSVVVVPLVSQNRGIGEIILASRSVGFFDRNDLILVSTTASQLSTAFEKALLIAQTDESLQDRLAQLLSVIRVSRELNATTDEKSLLQRVYDEALYITKADCGSISLFDLSLSESSPPKVRMTLGETVQSNSSSLEVEALSTGEAILVDTYRRNGGKPGAEPAPPHPGILSSLLVPIVIQGRSSGLIHLHARSANYFTAASKEMMQSLAAQAAIALSNAQRDRDLHQHVDLLSHRVQAMTGLLKIAHSLTAGQTLEGSLAEIATGIQNSTPFRVVLIRTMDLSNGSLLLAASAGIPQEKVEELKDDRTSWAGLQNSLKPEHCISRSYLITGDRQPFLLPGSAVTPGDQPEIDRPDHMRWHSKDILLVPLQNAAGDPFGVIQVDAPQDGLRPNRATLDTLELYASQAASLIESFDQLDALTQKAEELKREVNRSQSALQSVQNHLPVLLHKDVEHTLSIQQLNQRTRRIRASLDMIELVNQQASRLEALRIFGQEVLTRMEMDVVLVAEPSAGGLNLIYASGALPAGVTPQTLLGQRNPLRLSIQSGEPVFVTNLEENAEWKGSPLLSALDAKAFICIPILVKRASAEASNTGLEPDSALLAVSSTPVAALTIEDEYIFALLSRQVGDALADLETLSEMNHRLKEVNLLLEFSRQLGSLDTAQLLQSLLDSVLGAIPVADAGMVALWSSQKAFLQPQCAKGYLDNDKILQITYASGEGLPGKVFEQGQPLKVDEVNFAQHYNLAPQFLMLYRDATQGKLPVSSLVIPLLAFDTNLGVLVLDNFKTPASFTASDQALVTSLTRQTTLALENARLYQASETRLAQLQALTRVAGTITSSLQVNELISSILDQVRSIIPFETGTFWLRQGNILTVRAGLGFEDSEERIGLSVALEDSLLLKEMITTSQPLVVGDVRNDPRFPSLVEPRYLSWMGIPLLSKNNVVGVIALEKLEANFYTPEHVQAMVTFAGQAAVAMENANLYQESVRRAQELDERSERLVLLNRVSASLSRSLDQATIFSVISQEIPLAVTCSLVSVIAFDGSGHAWVHAQQPPFSGQLPLQIPPNPVFDRLRETLGIFTTEDYPSEPELTPIFLYLAQTHTRSLLILPMVSGTDLLGLVLVHTQDPYRFTADEIDLARTICNQAAVAIQNARLFTETERLFAETQKRSTEISILYDLGVGLTQVQDEERLLEVTFENVTRLIKAETVSVVLLGEAGQLTTHTQHHRIPQPPVVTAEQENGFNEHVMRMNSPLLVTDSLSEGGGLPVGLIPVEAIRSWLGVPLVARGSPAGVISVQGSAPGCFDEDDLRLLQQVANNLTVSLDNSQLFSKVQSYAADLEKRVEERTHELAQEHRRIQTLLSIITELSASLDLDLVLSRTLAVINETIEAEHSVIMMIQPDGTSLYLRASLGYSSALPKGGQPSAIKANQGLAGWVIAHREPVMIGDLWTDSRWVQREEHTAPHRSALAVPLMVGADILGVMMLFHRRVDHFSTDQLDLVEATAKQIAVAINNAQLYNLIRDQAERLGDMLRTQHVETSRSQAILEAVADGVLVTDARRLITLFNASAEKILGLRRPDVVGHSLDHFTGLFGKAGQSWVQTIQKWSEDPSSYQPGVFFEEQLELDNRMIVSVRLSPVYLRNDFLGTVSIFRDITHEVEVDRLKSEFVATVSHELRTPMTSIKGYVEVLLMGAGGPLSQQQQGFLQVVKANTERLAVLVNDLLDVSRIEAGKVTLLLQPLDLKPMIDEALSTISRRMKDEERPMALERDFPPDIPLVIGDPDRLRQILDNLVENAYQYTPANGRIVVRARQKDQMVQVDVQDNGIGIPADDGERVFERFYRGEDPLVLATSGTGLGLSIVKTLVEMHQGQLWFESTGVPGEGCTFSFTLPAHLPGGE